MEILFLGTGDAFGSGGRNQVSIYIKSGEIDFLLDCGPTVLSAIKRYGISTSQIKFILVSHLHGDHFGGIPYIFLDCQYVTRRDDEMVILGPQGIEEKVEKITDALYPEIASSKRNFKTRYIILRESNKQVLNDIEITPFKMIHQTYADSLGYKIKHLGKTISYTGDTGLCNSIFELADESDLMICECTNYTSQFTTHLNYMELISNKDKLNSKRILLIHLGAEIIPYLNNLQLEYTYDGMKIKI